MEGWLAHGVRGDAYGSTVVRFPDPTYRARLPHRAAQEAPRSSQESLTVREALSCGVATTVNDPHPATASGSTRLPHAHVPLHKPPDLSFSEPALHHALYELAVLLISLAVLL